jgi:glycosyltransferase involved in cell wall biosynthesis
MPLSVVIVCKNEAAVIAATLKSLEGVTDDIVVYDNGSTDNTVAIARQSPANVHEGTWEGFGKTKQKANALAKYDWILSLDADESIDEELNKSLLSLHPPNEETVYSIRFKNFLGNKYLRHGEWGTDAHIRLFNRKTVKWDDAPVHERLVLPPNVNVLKLDGFVLHRTMKDVHDYARKMVHYAMLGADRYYRDGKRSSWLKIRLSPAFNFFNYYILKLGFLDGYEGYVCAKMTAYYTFLKYSRLKELNRAKQKGA